jgi:hypothetical protein
MTEEVPLKRADHFKRELRKLIGEIRFSGKQPFSVFSPALGGSLGDGWSGSVALLDGEIARLADKERAKLQQWLDYVGAEYRIRLLVETANARVGVNTRLNRMNRLAAEVAAYRALLKAAEDVRGAESETVTAYAKAKSLRDNKGDRYSLGREDVVEMRLFSEDEISQFRQQVKALVEEEALVKDELTALNITSRVELDDETVTVLRQAGLLKSAA